MVKLLKMPEHIRDCILDEYVVMPDHFHGIVFVPDSAVFFGLIITLARPQAGRGCTSDSNVRVRASFVYKEWDSNMQYTLR